MLLRLLRLGVYVRLRVGCECEGGGEGRNKGFSVLCWILAAWDSGGERCAGLWRATRLEAREESLGFLVVLGALRSQYCAIRHVKNMKNCERYRHIFAPGRIQRGLISKKNPPLSFLPLHFGKKPWEDAFAIPAEEKPPENSPMQYPGHSWDIFERETCSSTVNASHFISLLGSR